MSSDSIPLSVPHLGGNEWTYVRECLDTSWVSSAGAFVGRFERMVADRAARAHGVATVNGTAAIHVALLVAGVGPDDEVVMPAMTFIAPANAVRYIGAWPAFVDVERDHGQLDPQKLADFVERECEWTHGALRNRRTGRRVRAVLPVDLLGHPCDVEPILAIARSRDLVVVEDATESLGAMYRGGPVGAHGDVACFSFNGNKIVTAGGGGAIVTDNAAWAERARYLTTQAKDDPIEHVHGAVGFNYRLTNLQAALAVAQLEQLDRFVEAKRAIAKRYAGAFAGVPGLRVLGEAAWARSTYWLNTVLIDAGVFGLDSRSVLRALAAERIEARPLWQPLHRSPAHRGSAAFACDTAEALHRDALNLPSSVGLSAADQDRVAHAVAAAAPAR